MIGGLLTIFVACWVYQGAVSVNRGKIFKWVIIGAILFYVVQVTVMGLEIYFFVDEDDADLTSELGGRIQATYRELMPSIIALLVAGVYRTKLVMKEKLSIGNIFSGMNIFKGSLDTDTKDAGSDS